MIILINSPGLLCRLYSIYKKMAGSNKVSVFIYEDAGRLALHIPDNIKAVNIKY